MSGIQVYLCSLRRTNENLKRMLHIIQWFVVSEVCILKKIYLGIILTSNPRIFFSTCKYVLLLLYRTRFILSEAEFTKLEVKQVFSLIKPDLILFTNPVTSNKMQNFIIYIKLIQVYRFESLEVTKIKIELRSSFKV